ncbi:hypothetical protein NQZ71_26030 (plasmid) [Niallia taxi]|uniref:hypothetical protein n=1 Tax=Niallia taxi TaxID=2499688 RepID=UPI002934E313|nr:hypothetical protein [Niallia taxi]WOD65328.1 hypothetical protein NQZ71_26030 [Niallia taxi]
MKMKISISLSIFGLLFLSFWQLDHREKREFFLNELDIEIKELIPINNELEKTFQNKTEAFHPREYVRVDRVS